MGTLLDKPVTDKTTEDESSGNGLKFGASAMQGWRVEMEDSHTIVPNIEGLLDHSFVAVYDGHGGAFCAEFAGRHMLQFLMETEGYQQYVKSGASDPSHLEEGLQRAFLNIDEALRDQPMVRDNADRSGCTAIAAVITPTHVVIAHAGDSRAVVRSGGQVVWRTDDHKPFNEGERQRIENAGGCVSMKRVDGDLAVSRALGDFQYKDAAKDPRNTKVTAHPETKTHARLKSDEVLVLACDGIWDVMNNQEAASCVADVFQQGEQQVGKCCEELIDLCLLRGSRDNMSAVIVAFEGCTFGTGEGVDGRRRKRQAEVETHNLGDDDSSELHLR